MHRTIGLYSAHTCRLYAEYRIHLWRCRNSLSRSFPLPISSKCYMRGILLFQGLDCLWLLYFYLEFIYWPVVEQSVKCPFHMDCVQKRRWTSMAELLQWMTRLSPIRTDQPFEMDSTSGQPITWKKPTDRMSYWPDAIDKERNLMTRTWSRIMMTRWRLRWWCRVDDANDDDDANYDMTCKLK